VSPGDQVAVDTATGSRPLSRETMDENWFRIDDLAPQACAPDTPSRPSNGRHGTQIAPVVLARKAMVHCNGGRTRESDKTATLTRARAFKPLVEIVLEEHRR